MAFLLALDLLAHGRRLMGMKYPKLSRSMVSFGDTPRVEKRATTATGSVAESTLTL